MEKSATAAILSRIEKRRKALKLSARKISIAAGYGPDLIRDWRGPKSPQPRLDSLEAVARVLGVTAGWLAFGEDGEAPEAKTVPVISWVAAGSFTDAFPYGDVEDARRIPTDIDHSDHCFALEVHGDSMDLIAPDRSIIIVDPTSRELLSKKYYVFRQGDEVTFKQFLSNPDRLHPFSSNRDHEAMPVTEETSVVGRVIRVIVDVS